MSFEANAEACVFVTALPKAIAGLSADRLLLLAAEASTGVVVFFRARGSPGEVTVCEFSLSTLLGHNEPIRED